MFYIQRVALRKAVCTFSITIAIKKKKRFYCENSYPPCGQYMERWKEQLYPAREMFDLLCSSNKNCLNKVLNRPKIWTYFPWFDHTTSYMSLLLFKAEKVALSLGPTCNFTHLILGHNECSWIEYFDILIMRNCRITVHSYFKHFFLLPFYVKQQNNTTGYRYYLIDTGFFVCFLFFLFFFF